MKKFIVGIAACLVALSIVVPVASAAGGWRNFKAADLDCEINKTGSAFCIVTGGQLDGWSVSAGNWGMDVENAKGRKVWKKKSVGTDRTDVSFSRSDWPYQNSGVACRKMSYTAACMIREGSMEGWAFIVSGDSVGIYNADPDVDGPIWRRGMDY